MKKAVLLMLLAVSIVFYANTASAVMGVADDVPGTDIVIPLICEKDGTMNTLWAVGDIFANGIADILVYDKTSNLIYDDVEEWTTDDPDIVASDCQTLIAKMSDAQRAALEMSIGGRTYYVGYMVYFNWFSDSDQFIPWVYLVDLVRGFASGYNGFAAEIAVGLSGLGEDNGAAPVTAVALFPRYYIGNDRSETWNWWIVLLGSNDSDRILGGVICNEEEQCISLSIPIPNELNIIDVEGYIPAILHADYPKAGMGLFSIVNAADLDIITVLGWSYQRLEASTVSASWDVIHPMHRIYLPQLGGL
ncbi:MAG: hypothetical protein AB1499_17210 [Nitrospirota bacterium]